MLAEYLMHRHGWDSVWYAHPGGSFLRSAVLRELRFWRRGPGRCMVGVWTGPQGDLLCLRRCATSADAERWLSPPGLTVTTAAVRAALKAAWLRRLGGA